MDTITEPAREVPVAADVELCVVGGSCTGVFAAVAAARLGLNVAILEANGFFGGVATGGLVNVWHSTFDTVGRRRIIAGLTAEVIERLAARAACLDRGPHPDCSYRLNTAELKIELDEMIAESGVRPFLHARFVRAAHRDGRASAAIIEDKSGRRAVRARVFIDATGDGDLIASMGLPYRKLPDLQPPTCCAHIHGLDGLAAANPSFDLAAAVFAERDAHALPRGFLWASKVVGLETLRMVAGTRVPDTDCSDADELTRAEIEGRRQVRAVCDLLRSYEGGRDVALLHLPACIGVRESRHAACLHTLTQRELLHGKRFDDAIANGSYRVDIHHSGRAGLTFRYLDGREVYVAPGRRPTVRRWRAESRNDPTFYQIPYRSLVAREATNVLVAGRLIDADRGAYGAVRVMVNCNQTGQAAGAAAALAVRHGTNVAHVDPAELRRTLAGQGAVVI